MAFKMKPGRTPFMQTGHGIPTPFMQPKTNAGTGEDLSAQARAMAEAQAKEKQLAAGENTGDSKNVRNFNATATVTKEGKKVEKLAKTPEEIKRWQAASEENKAKYKKQSATETVNLSDVGKDKPTIPPPTPTAEEPKNYGMWHQNITGSNSNNFGGSIVTGRVDPSTTEGVKFIEASQLKDYTDKYQGKGFINRNIASSSKNSFGLKPVTEEENRVSRLLGNNVVSPYDKQWADKKGENAGTGEIRRQNYIAGRVNYINEKESKDKARQEAKDKRIAEAKQKAEEFKNSRSKKPAAVAMQLKNKGVSSAIKMKTPAKMKKC
jgi:hypothetical protein